MLKKVNTSSPAIRIDQNLTYSGNGNDAGKDILVFDNSYYLMADMASGPTTSRLALIRTTETGSNPVFTYFGEKQPDDFRFDDPYVRRPHLACRHQQTSGNSSSMALIKVNPDGSF